MDAGDIVYLAAGLVWLVAKLLEGLGKRIAEKTPGHVAAVDVEAARAEFVRFQEEMPAIRRRLEGTRAWTDRGIDVVWERIVLPSIDFVEKVLFNEVEQAPETLQQAVTVQFRMRVLTHRLGELGVQAIGTGTPVGALLGDALPDVFGQLAEAYPRLQSWSWRLTEDHLTARLDPRWAQEALLDLEDLEPGELLPAGIPVWVRAQVLAQGLGVESPIPRGTAPVPVFTSGQWVQLEPSVVAEEVHQWQRAAAIWSDRAFRRIAPAVNADISTPAPRPRSTKPVFSRREENRRAIVLSDVLPL